MTPRTEPIRCLRCTLPVEPAVVGRYLRADRDGVCDFCRAWDWREARFPGFEAARAGLDALVARARRRRGRYDALIPISGGKDSLAVLDLVRHEFPDLRILAADEVIGASARKPDPYFGPLFHLVGLARRIAGLAIA